MIVALNRYVTLGTLPADTGGIVRTYDHWEG